MRRMDEGGMDEGGMGEGGMDEGGMKEREWMMGGGGNG